MTTLFVLDVPENVPVADVAGADPSVSVGKIGPYFEITSAGPIVIDRRATGCRHAVWYSSVAGLGGSRITQHDKDALRVEPMPVEPRHVDPRLVDPRVDRGLVDPRLVELQRAEPQ